MARRVWFWLPRFCWPRTEADTPRGAEQIIPVLHLRPEGCRVPPRQAHLAVHLISMPTLRDRVGVADLRPAAIPQAQCPNRVAPPLRLHLGHRFMFRPFLSLPLTFCRAHTRAVRRNLREKISLTHPRFIPTILTDNRDTATRTASAKIRFHSLPQDRRIVRLILASPMNARFPLPLLRPINPLPIAAG